MYVVLEAPSSVTGRRGDVGGDLEDEVDEDEEFRDMRKQIRHQVLERRNSLRRTPRSTAPSAASAGSRNSRGAVTAAAVLGPSTGLGVDPIYFDYAAATRTLRAKVQAEKAAAGQDPSAQGSADQTHKEMVAFLSSHGLSGPIRAYAKALALQGVASPSELLQTESTKLSRILTLAELESTDELLLLDALRQLR